MAAVKNACRRLGITEWPYKKKPMDDPSEHQDTEAGPFSPAATSNSMVPTTVMFDRTSYLPQPQMPSLLPQNYAQVCASSWPANPMKYVKGDPTRLRDGQQTYATLLNPLQLEGGGGTPTVKQESGRKETFSSSVQDLPPFSSDFIRWFVDASHEPTATEEMKETTQDSEHASTGGKHSQSQDLAGSYP